MVFVRDGLVFWEIIHQKISFSITKIETLSLAVDEKVYIFKLQINFTSDEGIVLWKTLCNQMRVHSEDLETN